MLLALKTQNAIGAFLSTSVFGYVAANFTLAVGVVCFFFVLFFLEKAGRFCSTKHQELEPSFRLSE